jgi:phosphoenolpyruvate-protein kinase (PTS system EI component)
MRELMTPIIALVALILGLLLLAGGVTGAAIRDAEHYKALLKSEREEYRKAIADLSIKMAELQEQADRVASTKNEAILDWHMRSLQAQAEEVPTWPPPKPYRGMGGPGPKRGLGSQPKRQ